MGKFLCFSLSLSLSLFLFLFASCRDGALEAELPYEPPIAAGETAVRACLVYIVADNNLNSFLQADLTEMCKGAAGVPADCFMLAYVDDAHSPRILRFFNNEGVGDYETVRNFEREMDSCSADDMCEVLEWVKENYPSLKMDLIMWSHATGWLYDDNRRNVSRSFGYDGNRVDAASPARMNVEELAALLQRVALKPERLFFDACFMQCAESAYALRECADWIIASPAEIPAYGAPYDVIVPLLFDDEAGIQDIIDAYKEAYEGSDTGVVLSAVRCAAMEALASATADVVRECLLPTMHPDYGSLFAYLPGGRWTGGARYPCFYDMNAVMLGCVPFFSEYSKWKAALDAAVPYGCASGSWWSDVVGRYVSLSSAWCGISMYLPKDALLYPANLNEDFAFCEWYEAAGWKEAGW